VVDRLGGAQVTLLERQAQPGPATGDDDRGFGGPRGTPKSHYVSELSDGRRHPTGGDTRSWPFGGADQRRSCTEYCVNDRLDCVEGRTQRAVDVVPLGQEPR
jgi:hypothetical protein